jgi:hypothetical protein
MNITGKHTTRLLAASLLVLILAITLSDLFHNHHYCLPDPDQHFGGCSHECPVHVLQAGIIGAAVVSVPEAAIWGWQHYLAVSQPVEPDWAEYHELQGRSPPA